MLSGMFCWNMERSASGGLQKAFYYGGNSVFWSMALFTIIYNVHADGVVLPVWKHAGRYLAQSADGQASQGRPYVVYVCHCVFLYLCALSVQDGKKYDGPGNEGVPASNAGHPCGGGWPEKSLDWTLKPWAQFVLYTGWVYFFLLGYGLKRLCRKEQFPIFAVPGSFGLAMDVAADIGLSWWVPKLPISRQAMVFIAPEYFFCFEYYGGKGACMGRKAGNVVSRYSFFPSI